MTFGQRLKDLRTQQSMTQQELADRSHIARSTLGMYEQDRRRPDFESLDTLADFFDVSFDYLLGKNEINDGYPRHDIVVAATDGSLSMDRLAESEREKRFYKRVAAYYEGLHGKIVTAYDAASPDTQAAVRAILHVEEDPDGDR